MKNMFVLLSTVISLFVSTTGEKQPSVKIEPSVAARVDSLSGACPHVTKDNKGNTVLSWVRNLNDTSSIFCYAISKDGGRTFSKTVTIPSSVNIHAHAENLPKIIFKPSGEILAVWGTRNPGALNKYAGLVNYAQSFDEGKTWTGAKALVEDTAGYDQRYSDLALLANGEAAIIWLDNRTTNGKDGAALYFASTDERKGFRNEKLISQSCCQCCRTDLFIDSKSNIHVLYRGIIQDSIRDMVHAISVDGGKTFSQPKQINNDHWVLYGCPHTGPAMMENKTALHFVWYTGGGKKGVFYTRTANNGVSFTGYDSISHVGRHPQLAASPRGELTIVWDESIKHVNQLNKRIGVQIRTRDGRRLGTHFITPDSHFSSYPVVSALDDSLSLVAYCKKEGGKNYIMYQRVNFHAQQ